MSAATDVTIAARLLLKDRWFTFAAASALALGIAATTATFSIVDAIMLRPLPFEGSERTLLLTTENTAAGVRERFDRLAYQDYLEWRAAARTLEGIGA